jgi:hypothetical protein
VPEANCTDTVDNDLDGATDCDDSDCATLPACYVTGNDSCAAGPYVLPDDPNGAWRGTIDALASDHRGTCGGNGGRDAVFQFTLTAGANITATLEGSTFDTVLYLRSGACTVPGVTEEACNDDAGGAGVLWSRISTTESAGTYWLVVDAASAATATGTYVLTINVTP